MTEKREVEMFILTLPLTAIKALTNEQRFAYYLLGHIFNELMCLQKLVAFALPKHDDDRPARRRPEIGQAMFLFRLASGKIWEASVAIRKTKELVRTLSENVLPNMPNGEKRLEELNIAVNCATWLSPLRNGIGFHFPTFQRWCNHITPNESWENDTIYLGETSGNTYYDAADSIAQAWMFEQFGDNEIHDAVDPLIEQMINLLRIMNSFLEDALGVFVADVILDGPTQRQYVGKVLAPEIEQVSMPFWTAMPNKSL